MAALEEAINECVSAGLLRGVLSHPHRTSETQRKVTLRPLVIKGQAYVQLEYDGGDKVTHENVPAHAAATRLAELLRQRYRQATLCSAQQDLQVLISKKGKETILRRAAADVPSPELAAGHNRTKKYIIPEGPPCDFLVKLGVMNLAGKVRAEKFDKFRQINRFLEMVADVAEALPAQGTLRVVDFGAGKAYLTFAIYHYLHRVLGRNVKMVGIDLKRDVVARGNEIATSLHMAGLSFESRSIDTFGAQEKTDLVVSLHACNTATDDALAQALAMDATVILAVPCCQHELTHQIQNDILRPLLKHGLFRERVASLVTDALRAELLELAGYKVDVLEFVDSQHTAKNIMLRAVKKTADNHLPTSRAAYEQFRNFWNIKAETRPH